MSKTYFGRCAAVGIAGLTAMSSIAIVASAATQASIVYELKYTGIDSILMKTTVAYANQSTEFCKYDTVADAGIEGGFNVKLDSFSTYPVKYDTVTASGTTLSRTPTDLTNVWDTTKDFANISSSMDAAGASWKFQTLKSDLTATEDVALKELYAVRTGTGTDVIIGFKTDAERNAAKASMITAIKTEYIALANPAITQFKNDINKVVANARKRVNETKDKEIKDAQTTYNGSGKTPDDSATLSAATQTANNKCTAALNAINTISSKIISEFTQTFNANNFNYDLAFTTNNAPIKLSASVGGLSPMADAEYTGLSGTAVQLENARYWTGSTMRDRTDTTNKSYVFTGEIQPEASFTAGGNYLFLGNIVNWVNFQVIDNPTTSGGNTTPTGTPVGSTTTTTDQDTTDKKITTWYPDSPSYRAASEVSYLGENGSWYTSSGAASIYGGGYTGTSKASNYTSVNNSANGKAIYFDSTTGTYTTASTSYSYIVKEASTNTTDSSTDPYYLHFFGNTGNIGNNTTNTVPAGSPAINGASKFAGWTNIAGYITNRARSGASYTINMNDGTVVPAAVIAAAKAKNVTLTFANDNGSKIVVKPGKVSTTSDLNVATKYNVKDVKSSLVKKAKKVNPGTVSTAQVRIGEDGSLGGTATVNVKFSKKRSGCTVKAYRLTESGSLRKEATGTIASNGRVNLNLTKGGSYLLVVID